MHRILSATLLLLAASLVAEEVKSPRQIQLEIEQAQRDFEIAQSMFIPWYTGPLITSSAHNVPQGHINFQPYFYTTLNYAAFNNEHVSKKIQNVYVFNPAFVTQAGITHWLDVTIIPQAFFRWRDGHSAQRFGDLPVQFGLQALHEGPYKPSIRFVVGAVFPTGQHQWLEADRGGIDAAGSGAFITTLGVNLSKVLWWSLKHPMQMRLVGNYNFADNRVHVRSFNAYGGGYGTKGKVKVGNTLNLDYGLEVSLNQKWVLATDIAYTYSNKSTFTGTPGVTATGEVAVTGGPSSDQLSLAPAIEYNVNENGGFIGGVWFSVYGRNSTNFVSLVLSYTQMF